MKDRPILFLAIALTLVVEVVLMIVVYNKVGPDRLPAQLGRLAFQLLLILWLSTRRSGIALFLLAGYHIVSAIFGMNSTGSAELLGQALIGFHLIIGVVIYFHQSIENRIRIKKVD
ncbi:hypothetical protein [Gilvibacter sediminis]|uniref:hypothetical protein n=1 Tax=Gilvibacter sediminis TaxID=379071 RepID=UPI0023509043|nr:hypothetical protein [Gilvibacter sediminis]MDC7997993.1 hypothetical protein [Gilvibacter sediminis]